jgi:ABC-type transport system substrate-binding protein
VLMCLTLVVSACSADQAEDPTTTGADDGGGDPGATTTPDDGEGEGGGEEVTRLVFGVPPPPDGESNNPNRDIQPNDEYQLKPMYENLVGVDPETAQWVPMLAESWELNEAGDQLTFHLRQGVQFHNDFGEMTAADVVFSLTDLIDPPGAISGVAEAVRNAVEEFEIVDDYTVIFHITEGGLSYSFFEGISYGAAGTAIKSQADWESRGGGSPASPTLDEAPIAGTGPYQFVERTPGQNIVFEKVPYEHWRQDAAFDEFEYRFIPEDATRLSALLADEIHLTGLPAELGDEAESQGMGIIKSVLPGRRYGLALEGCYYVEPPQPGALAADVFVSGERKFPDSPWCNEDIRRAASKAIDRDALNEAFYGGEAETAIMWYWLPEQTDSWNPDWETRYPDEVGYDPDGAAETSPRQLQSCSKRSGSWSSSCRWTTGSSRHSAKVASSIVWSRSTTRLVRTSPDSNRRVTEIKTPVGLSRQWSGTRNTKACSPSSILRRSLRSGWNSGTSSSTTSPRSHC